MSENYNLNEICRCCHRHGVFKCLNKVYIHEGREEVYSNMIERTFGIVYPKVVHVDGPSKLSICNTCIRKLRDADKFKEQVVACEENLGKIYNICNTKEIDNKDSELVLFVKKELQFQGNIKDLKDEENSQTGVAEQDVYETKYISDDKTPADIFTQAADLDDQPLLVLKSQESTDFPENWASGPDSTDDEESKGPKKIVPKKYACTVCCKEFSYNGSLEQHMKVHSKSGYQCHICKDTFSQKKEVVSHIDAKHSDNGRYPCNICSKIFEKARMLTNHLTLHFDSDRYQCDHCKKSYQRLRGLREHMKTHSGERNFKCNVCSKAFYYNHTLKTHLLTHTGEKPYVCDVCGKRYLQKSHLTRHIYITHKGVKPFSCMVCKKNFSTKTYLSIHARKHTGEKPFSCDVCKKVFAAYSTLKIHMRLHTGQKPYPCKFCDRQFAQVSGRRLHERTHTGEKPFSCKVCNKLFADNGYLKIHMRIHTGERPYNCQVCDKNFKEMSQLNRHLRTHSAYKMTCKVCNKQFGNLPRHMRVHSIDRHKFGARVKKKDDF